MLQALQVEPLLTLDGVVEGPLTNVHDLQEGAQGRVRVAVLPKQLGGTGNRLLVIERDAARHGIIITLFVATAKNILTRGAAGGSTCSDCYISRRSGAGALDGKVAIVTSAETHLGGHREGTWLAGPQIARQQALEPKNTKAGQCDDPSALHRHRTPFMEARYRATRQDVFVDER